MENRLRAGLIEVGLGNFYDEWEKLRVDKSLRLAGRIHGLENERRAHEADIIKQFLGQLIYIANEEEVILDLVGYDTDKGWVLRITPFHGAELYYRDSEGKRYVGSWSHSWREDYGFKENNERVQSSFVGLDRESHDAILGHVLCGFDIWIEPDEALRDGFRHKSPNLSVQDKREIWRKISGIEQSTVCRIAYKHAECDIVGAILKATQERERGLNSLQFRDNGIRERLLAEEDPDIYRRMTEFLPELIEIWKKPEL